MYNQTILFDGGAILVRQLCRSALTKYIFPQPVGPVIFAVNGCWKRNSFSTSLVAAVEVAAGAAAVVDIHDCLNVSIDDASGGGCGDYT